MAAAVVFGLGECLHATALLIPLIADLAPLHLRGRYLATGLSWWLGLALAPTAGGQLLAISPAR